MASKTLRLRSLVGAIVLGVLVSLASGLVENPPEASITIATYYGYPLVWRVTMTFQPTEFKFASLAIDVIFWFAISFVALIILEKITPRSRKSINQTRRI